MAATETRRLDEFHQIDEIDPEEGWPVEVTDHPEAQHYIAAEWLERHLVGSR